MTVSVNYVAVLLAAVASMGVGFLWYSNFMFGKPWAKIKGYTPESLTDEKAKMGPLYVLSFIMSLFGAYVLTHVMVYTMKYYDLGAIQTGITSALFMWFGFVMPTQVTGQIFGEKKWTLLAIDTSHQFASLLVMGIVLGLFMS